MFLWIASIGLGQSSLTALGTVMALNSSAMYIGMMFASAGASWLLAGEKTFVAIGILCAIASFLVLPIVRYLIKEESATNQNGNHLQFK